MVPTVPSQQVHADPPRHPSREPSTSADREAWELALQTATGIPVPPEAPTEHPENSDSGAHTAIPERKTDIPAHPEHPQALQDAPERRSPEAHRPAHGQQDPSPPGEIEVIDAREDAEAEVPDVHHAEHGRPAEEARSSTPQNHALHPQTVSTTGKITDAQLSDTGERPQAIEETAEASGDTSGGDTSSKHQQHEATQEQDFPPDFQFQVIENAGADRLPEESAGDWLTAPLQPRGEGRRLPGPNVLQHATRFARWMERLLAAPGKPSHLPDGWKGIQLALDDAQLTLRARRHAQGFEITATTSHPHLQAQLAQDLHRIERLLQERYDAPVSFSMDTSGDQRAPDPEPPAFTSQSGSHRQKAATPQTDSSIKPSLAPNEWIG